MKSKAFFNKQRKAAVKIAEVPVNDIDLMNFRLRQNFEKRNSVLFNALYVAMIGAMWFSLKRKHITMVSIANSDIFVECSKRIARHYPNEKFLLLNETSIGGQIGKELAFDIQFSTKQEAGIARFKGKIDNLKFTLTQAILEIKNNGETKTIPLTI